MNQKKSRFSFQLRAASLLIAFLFTFDSLAGAAPDRMALAAQARSENAFLSLTDIRIPEEIGTVEERFIPSGPLDGKPFIIHVRDAHAQPEAQRHIQAILEQLAGEKKIKTVTAEAAFGKIDADLLKLLPDTDANRAVAEDLTQAGQVNGVERFAMNASGIELRGAEDRTLYQSSLEIFKRLKRSKEEIQSTLKRYETSLEAQQSKVLNAELKNYLIQKKAWEQNRDMSMTYFRVIRQLAAKHLGIDLTDPRFQFEWPHAVRLMKADEMESKVDSEKAAAQGLELAGVLKDGYFSEGIREIVSKESSGFELWMAQHPHAGVKTLRGFFEALWSETRTREISLLQYPDFLAWSGLLILRGEIDAPSLFKEIASLEARIESKLITTETEKEIFGLSADLALVAKLFALQMSREDYQTFEKAGNFQPEVFGRRFEKFPGGNDLPVFRAEWVHDAEKFYELSVRRDQTLVSNALKAASGAGTVLVAGGFHSRGLLDLLKAQNIPYVSIMPKIGKIEDETLYEKIMLGTEMPGAPAAAGNLGILFLKYRPASAAPLLKNEYRKVLGRMGWSETRINAAVQSAAARRPDIFGQPTAVNAAAPQPPTRVSIGEFLSNPFRVADNPYLIAYLSGVKSRIAGLAPRSEMRSNTAFKYYDSFVADDGSKDGALVEKVKSLLKTPEVSHWAGEAEKITEQYDQTKKLSANSRRILGIVLMDGWRTPALHFFQRAAKALQEIRPNHYGVSFNPETGEGSVSYQNASREQVRMTMNPTVGNKFAFELRSDTLSWSEETYDFEGGDTVQKMVFGPESVVLKFDDYRFASNGGPLRLEIEGPVPVAGLTETGHLAVTPEFYAFIKTILGSEFLRFLNLKNAGEEKIKTGFQPAQAPAKTGWQLKYLFKGNFNFKQAAVTAAANGERTAVYEASGTEKQPFRAFFDPAVDQRTASGENAEDIKEIEAGGMKVSRSGRGQFLDFSVLKDLGLKPGSKIRVVTFSARSEMRKRKNLEIEMTPELYTAATRLRSDVLFYLDKERAQGFEKLYAARIQWFLDRMAREYGHKTRPSNPVENLNAEEQPGNIWLGGGVRIYFEYGAQVEFTYSKAQNKLFIKAAADYQDRANRLAAILKGYLEGLAKEEKTWKALAALLKPSRYEIPGHKIDHVFNNVRSLIELGEAAVDKVMAALESLNEPPASEINLSPVTSSFRTGELRELLLKYIAANETLRESFTIADAMKAREGLSPQQVWLALDNARKAGLLEAAGKIGVRRLFKMTERGLRLYGPRSEMRVELPWSRGVFHLENPRKDVNDIYETPGDLQRGLLDRAAEFGAAAAGFVEEAQWAPLQDSSNVGPRQKAVQWLAIPANRDDRKILLEQITEEIIRKYPEQDYVYSIRVAGFNGQDADHYDGDMLIIIPLTRSEIRKTADIPQIFKPVLSLLMEDAAVKKLSPRITDHGEDWAAFETRPDAFPAYRVTALRKVDFDPRVQSPMLISQYSLKLAVKREPGDLHWKEVEETTVLSPDQLPSKAQEILHKIYDTGVRAFIDETDRGLNSDQRVVRSFVYEQPGAPAGRSRKWQVESVTFNGREDAVNMEAEIRQYLDRIGGPAAIPVDRPDMFARGFHGSFYLQVKAGQSDPNSELVFEVTGPGKFFAIVSINPYTEKSGSRSEMRAVHEFVYQYQGENPPAKNPKWQIEFITFNGGPSPALWKEKIRQHLDKIGGPAAIPTDNWSWLDASSHISYYQRVNKHYRNPFYELVFEILSGERLAAVVSIKPSNQKEAGKRVRAKSAAPVPATAVRLDRRRPRSEMRTTDADRTAEWLKFEISYQDQNLLGRRDLSGYAWEAHPAVLEEDEARLAFSELARRAGAADLAEAFKDSHWQDRYDTPDFILASPPGKTYPKDPDTVFLGAGVREHATGRYQIIGFHSEVPAEAFAEYLDYLKAKRPGIVLNYHPSADYRVYSEIQEASLHVDGSQKVFIYLSVPARSEMRSAFLTSMKSLPASDGWAVQDEGAGRILQSGNEFAQFIHSANGSWFIAFGQDKAKPRLQIGWQSDETGYGGSLIYTAEGKTHSFQFAEDPLKRFYYFKAGNLRIFNFVFENEPAAQLEKSGVLLKSSGAGNFHWNVLAAGDDTLVDGYGNSSINAAAVPADLLMMTAAFRRTGNPAVRPYRYQEGTLYLYADYGDGASYEIRLKSGQAGLYKYPALGRSLASAEIQEGEDLKKFMERAGDEFKSVISRSEVRASLPVVPWNVTAEFTPEKSEPASWAFSPNGKILAVGFSDHHVELRDTSNGALIRRWDAHQYGGRILSLAFSPDGKTLATGAGKPDQTVNLWNVETGRHLLNLRRPIGAVNSIAFTRDGTKILSSHENGILVLWNAQTGEEISSKNTGVYPMYAARFLPGDKAIAAANTRGQVQILDFDGRNLLESKVLGKPKTSRIYEIAVSGDGQTLAEVRSEEIVVWDLKTGREKFSIPRRAGDPFTDGISFSEDGRILAVEFREPGRDSQIHFYETASGKPLAVLPGKALRGGLFSAEGKQFAAVESAEGKFKIKLFDSSAHSAWALQGWLSETEKTEILKAFSASPRVERSRHFIKGPKEIEVAKVLSKPSRPLGEVEKDYRFFWAHGESALAAFKWLADNKNEFLKDRGDAALLTSLEDWLKGWENLVLRVLSNEGERDNAPQFLKGVLDVYQHLKDAPENVKRADWFGDVLEVTNALVQGQFLGAVSMGAFVERDGALSVPDAAYFFRWMSRGNIDFQLSDNLVSDVTVNVQRLTAGLHIPAEKLKIGLLIRPRHYAVIEELIKAGVMIPESGKAEFDKILLISEADKQKEAKKAFFKKLEAEAKKKGFLEFGNIRFIADGDMMPAFAVASGELDAVIGAGGPNEVLLGGMVAKMIGGSFKGRLVPAAALAEDRVDADITTAAWSDEERAKLLEHNLYPADVTADEKAAIARRIAEDPYALNRHLTEEQRDVTRYNWTTPAAVPGNDGVFYAATIKAKGQANPWVPELEGQSYDPATGLSTVYELRAALSGDIRVFKIEFETVIPDLKAQIEKDSAESSSNHSPELQSRLYENYYELGRALFHFKRYDDAMQAFEEAAKHAGGTQIEQIKAVQAHYTGLRKLVEEKENPNEKALPYFEQAVLAEHKDMTGYAGSRTLRDMLEKFLAEKKAKAEPKPASGARSEMRSASISIGGLNTPQDEIAADLSLLENGRVADFKALPEIRRFHAYNLAVLDGKKNLFTQNGISLDSFSFDPAGAMSFSTQINRKPSRGYEVGSGFTWSKMKASHYGQIAAIAQPAFPLKNARVLVLAGGSGAPLMEAAQNFEDSEIVLLDANAANIRAAAANIPKQNPGKNNTFAFRLADAREGFDGIGYPDGYFDLIIMAGKSDFGMSEDDMTRLTAEVTRALKPADGFFLFESDMLIKYHLALQNLNRAGKIQSNMAVHQLGAEVYLLRTSRSEMRTTVNIPEIVLEGPVKLADILKAHVPELAEADPAAMEAFWKEHNMRVVLQNPGTGGLPMRAADIQDKYAIGIKGGVVRIRYEMPQSYEIHDGQLLQSAIASIGAAIYKFLLTPMPKLSLAPLQVINRIPTESEPLTPEEFGKLLKHVSIDLVYKKENAALKVKEGLYVQISRIQDDELKGSATLGPVAGTLSREIEHRVKQRLLLLVLTVLGRQDLNAKPDELEKTDIGPDLLKLYKPQSRSEMRKLTAFERSLKGFTLSKTAVVKIERNVRKEMKAGLEGEPSSLAMIPTYVNPPTGKEEGTFMGLDLGGSNFRVLTMELKTGEQTKPVVMKFTIPKEIYMSDGERLFDFIAGSIAQFIAAHPDLYGRKISIGFTFSFPVDQTGIASGIITDMTKQFTKVGTVGEDPVQLLAKAFERLSAKTGAYNDEVLEVIRNLHVAALANDTVGTLSAGTREDEAKGHRTIASLIGGTGFNIAVWLDMIKIAKWKGEKKGKMAVNMEAGNFNKLPVSLADRLLHLYFNIQDIKDPEERAAKLKEWQELAKNHFDELIRRAEALPLESLKQTAEKQISGKYIGELLRQTILLLIHQDGWFGGKVPEALVRTEEVISAEDLGKIETDKTDGLRTVESILSAAGIQKSSRDQRRNIKKLAFAIATRSSQVIAAITTGAVAYSVPEGKKFKNNYNVAADGSLVEKFPGYQDRMKQVFVQLAGENGRKLGISLTPDGSGVGVINVAASVQPPEARSEIRKKGEEAARRLVARSEARKLDPQVAAVINAFETALLTAEGQDENSTDIRVIQNLVQALLFLYANPNTKDKDIELLLTDEKAKRYYREARAGSFSQVVRGDDIAHSIHSIYPQVRKKSVTFYRLGRPDQKLDLTITEDKLKKGDEEVPLSRALSSFGPLESLKFIPVSYDLRGHENPMAVIAYAVLVSNVPPPRSEVRTFSAGELAADEILFQRVEAELASHLRLEGRDLGAAFAVAQMVSYRVLGAADYAVPSFVAYSQMRFGWTQTAPVPSSKSYREQLTAALRNSSQAPVTPRTVIIAGDTGLTPADLEAMQLPRGSRVVVVDSLTGGSPAWDTFSRVKLANQIRPERFSTFNLTETELRKIFGRNPDSVPVLILPPDTQPEVLDAYQNAAAREGFAVKLPKNETARLALSAMVGHFKPEQVRRQVPDALLKIRIHSQALSPTSIPQHAEDRFAAFAVKMFAAGRIESAA